MTSIDFTDVELELMAKHNLAIFEDRLILDAQPPIDDDTIRLLEQHLSGPIPEDLLDLWRISFGGSLNYNLHLIHQDEAIEISMDQLFFPNSNHYFDLWGWIEFKIEWHKERAEEDGTTFDGKLDYLPFAGYDELERSYVCTRLGEDYGKAVFWSMGDLWLHPERKGEIASNLREAFSKLSLDRKLDELADLDDGQDFSYAFEKVRMEGPHGLELAEKLRAIVEATAIDWRAALKAGNLVGDPILEKIALEDIKRSDDVASMQQLLDEGLHKDQRNRLDGITIDMTYGGAWKVIELLRRSGASVRRIMNLGTQGFPLELARAIVEDGVEDGVEVRHEDIMHSLKMENMEVVEFLLEQFDKKAKQSERDTLFNKLLFQFEYYKKAAKQIDAGESNLIGFTSMDMRQKRDLYLRISQRFLPPSKSDKKKSWRRFFSIPGN